MENNKLTLQEATQRMRQYPVLEKTLGEDWLAQEYKKEPKQQSLITNWIRNKDDDFPGKQLKEWLLDIELALKILSPPNTSPETWRKLHHKIREHSDPDNFKGTLSEIAVCRLLTECRFSIELEKKLMSSSNKDVDIQVSSSNSIPLYIEVQWVSESDDSKDGAAVASLHGQGYPMQNDKEKLRIKRKIYDKTPKFTTGDITLVALDFTTSPELGGNHKYSVIQETLDEVYANKNLQGAPAEFYYSDIDITIRNYVDGIIWFRLEPDKKLGLMPQKRGLYINHSTKHYEKIKHSLFIQEWQGKTV